MNSDAIFKRIGEEGILPALVIPSKEQALPMVDAMAAGGVTSIEVLLRTPDALESIKKIAAERPDILVGCGTILTKENADAAMAVGARFLVSPGFDEKLVQYCIDKGYPVVPGTSGPSEIQKAVGMGLKVLKFFPAEQLGGTATLGLFSGAFPGVKFIVTGGVGAKTFKDYLAQPYILAVGGSMVAPKDLVKAGRYDEITETTKKTMADIYNFKIAHVGLNCRSAEESMELAQKFSRILNIPVIEHSGCNFAGTLLEINKQPGRGRLGHIGLLTDDLPRAAAYVEKMGVALDWENAKYFPDGKKVLCVFFKEDIAGFAFHLLQKK